MSLYIVLRFFNLFTVRLYLMPPSAVNIWSWVSDKISDIRIPVKTPRAKIVLSRGESRIFRMSFISLELRTLA